MRHDRCVLSERGISTRMVAVMVRVDEELQLALGELARGGADLFRQREELIIDHQHAVVADREADVSARTAVEHVDVPGHVVGLEVDF